MDEDITQSKIEEKLSNHISRIDIVKAKMLQYSTVTIAIISAIAYSFLYEYQAGYAKYFHIPAVCIAVDLKSYIQIMVQLSSLIIYILSYYFEFVSEKITNVFKFRIDRAIILSFILTLIFPKILKFSLISVLLANACAFLIETIIFFLINFKRNRRRRAEKEGPKESMQLDINERGRLYAQSILKRRSKLFAISIFIYFCIASCVNIAGVLKARNETMFSTIFNENKLYVVILDNPDTATVLDGATDEFGNLQITVGEYKQITKTEKVIKQVNYSSVVLIDNSIDYAKMKVTNTANPTFNSIQTTPPIVTIAPISPYLGYDNT